MPKQILTIQSKKSIYTFINCNEKQDCALPNALYRNIWKYIKEKTTLHICAQKRINRELFLINEKYRQNTQHGNIYAISQDKNNLSNCITTIVGPENTPYENCILKLNIKIPNEYPFKYPILNFITKIYHLNIPTNGHVSYTLLPTLSNWGPGVGLEKVINELINIIKNPNLHYIMRPELKLLYNNNTDLYNENATKSVNGSI